MIQRRVVWGLILLAVTLAGCGGQGAVIFAPTPLPPSVSPLRYEHPSRAFAVAVPRRWAVYAQNTATLASARFTPPGLDEAIVNLAVINLADSGSSLDLAAIINLYQGEVRPDARRYHEQERQAMGDGSWRLTGLRTSVGGVAQEVNTFIVPSGTFIGVIDAIIPADRTLRNELESAISTFTINTNSALEPTALSTLSHIAPARLELLNVTDWTTPDGVFFVTGEVANNGADMLAGVPVRVELLQADGAFLTGATDRVMGYGIPPGGIAPFSLRFGQGQPPLGTHYVLTLGGEDWQPAEIAPTVYGNEAMSWTEEFTFSPEGHLLVRGTLTNNGTQIIRAPLAIVTVFDAAQNVVGARYELITEGALYPDQSFDFELRVPEFGGEPADFFLNIQALPVQ